MRIVDNTTVIKPDELSKMAETCGAYEGGSGYSSGYDGC